MAATDEDALICDFAETYHVLNWRELPARLAATLAAGLDADSRIVRKLSGVPGKTADLLLAAIADACRVAVWQNSKAALHGQAPPASFFEALFAKKEQITQGFKDADDFKSWRSKILGGDL